MHQQSHADLTASQHELEQQVNALQRTKTALASSATARHSLQHAGIRLLQATHIARQFPASAATACDLHTIDRTSGITVPQGTYSGDDHDNDGDDDDPASTGGLARRFVDSSGGDDAASAVGMLSSSGHGQRLLGRLGLSRDTQAGMTAGMMRSLAREHEGVVQARGLLCRHHAGAGAGAGAGVDVLGVGNWTREHPVLGRDPDGRMDPRSVGVPDVLEMLDEGRVRVMDGVDPSCQGTGTG